MILHEQNFTLELKLVEQKAGKSRYSYRLLDKTMGEEPLFSGSDFSTPSNSDGECFEDLATLASFFSLNQDEVEPEYFEKYSDRALKWLETKSFEEYRQFARELSELAQICTSCLELAESNVIEWAEWEDDSFPIRLRFVEEQGYSLCWGNPSFDIDHRGYFGAGYLTPDTNPQEIWHEVKLMAEQVHSLQMV